MIIQQEVIQPPEPHLEDETRSERTRQLCALKYLHGYADYRVVDPIKENYPSLHYASGSYFSCRCDSGDSVQHSVCAGICGTCCIDPRDARPSKPTNEYSSVRALQE